MSANNGIIQAIQNLSLKDCKLSFQPAELMKQFAMKAIDDEKKTRAPTNVPMPFEGCLSYEQYIATRGVAKAGKSARAPAGTSALRMPTVPITPSSAIYPTFTRLICEGIYDDCNSHPEAKTVNDVVTILKNNHAQSYLPAVKAFVDAKIDLLPKTDITNRIAGEAFVSIIDDIRLTYPNIGAKDAKSFDPAQQSVLAKELVMLVTQLHAIVAIEAARACWWTEDTKFGPMEAVAIMRATNCGFENWMGERIRERVFELDELQKVSAKMRGSTARGTKKTTSATAPTADATTSFVAPLNLFGPPIAAPITFPPVAMPMVAPTSLPSAIPVIPPVTH